MKLSTIMNFYLKELNLNAENYFISQFKSSKIGDDGAVVGDFVYSKDAFFENVHFKKNWMSHYQIATKAMLVNISDALAMNATPLYALLSVAMPSSITKKEMQELVSGFEDVAHKYNIEIIGGDTLSNTKLDITITIISKTNKPLLRSTMRQKDLIAYTGELGKSAKDLRYLLRGQKLHNKSKFVNINLRDKFIQRTNRYISAGMDISDGLFSDLEKLSNANKGMGFFFYQQIQKQIACSGEEYEMLVSFDRRKRKTMLRFASLTRTKLTVVAKVQRKKYTNRCKSHHF